MRQKALWVGMGEVADVIAAPERSIGYAGSSQVTRCLPACSPRRPVATIRPERLRVPLPLHGHDMQRVCTQRQRYADPVGFEYGDEQAEG